MNNKILQLLLVPVFLLLALWVTNYVVTLPVFFQIYAGGIGIVLTVLLLVGRDLPFDFKFLCLLVLGYAIAGKGFAYLTPVEPFYIGEITLVICLVGYLMRCLRGAAIFPTYLHWLIFFWMTVIAMYLFADIPKFGLVAIRDSVMGYYGLFFFFAYAMFQKEATYAAVPKLFKWLIFLGTVSCVILISGLFEMLLEKDSRIGVLFFPHADSHIPLVCALATVGILQGTAKRSLRMLGLGLLGIFILMLSKTAGLFSFSCVLIVLLIFAKRMELMIASVATAAVGGIIAAMLIVGQSKFFEEKILQSDQIQTFSDVANAEGTGNETTSDWRVTWWKTIYEDTMAEDPAFGTGLGSDITSHFLEITFGNSDSTDFARYPHSIIFTVFGRLGYVGLGIFLILYFSMIRFSIIFVRTHFSLREVDTTALSAFAVFFSGMANALVQSTYEVPHGAIIHWVALAYMVTYHYRNKPAPALLPDWRRRPLPATAGPAA